MPGFLAIGPLAVLLGVTMWLTFRLTPMTDPIQKQMFSIMPWVLMFVMAPFSAGLLLYLGDVQHPDRGTAELPLLQASAAQSRG